MPDKLYISDYRLQAAGNIELSSDAEHFTIYATGLSSLLSLRAEGSLIAGCGDALLTLDNDMPGAGLAILQAGATGAVKLGAGLPLAGAEVVLEAEALTLSIGPPGAGASIKLTPLSITLQVAETKFEMTAAGIKESLAATTRELSPMGHDFAVAESTLGITPAGISQSAPMLETKAEAVATAKETLATLSTDAMKQQSQGVLMLG